MLTRRQKALFSSQLWDNLAVCPGLLFSPLQNEMCGLSHISRVRLFLTPGTVVCQAPPSMGFSRQEYYWSGLPFPPPGDLPNPGTELVSLLFPALAGRLLTTSTMIFNAQVNGRGPSPCRWAEVNEEESEVPEASESQG